MGKKPDPQIKSRLLEQIVAYILQNGLRDLSLRQLAEALDTNARMLLYHFGSKENLIVEALHVIETQQQAFFVSLNQNQSGAESLRAMWTVFTSEAMAPAVRLILEIEVLAIQGQTEYQQFAEETLKSWTELIAAQLKNCTPATAVLIVSVFQGLLMDYLVMGDKQRAEAGFEALLEMLEGGAA
jgi:AcrR family transcriptional regulator